MLDFQPSSMRCRTSFSRSVRATMRSAAHLEQLGQRSVDALTFNIVNQTKTIFTAIVLFLLIGQRQSKLQVLALCILFGNV